MKISVIVPTYKPQDYLWVCLDSIRNQTFAREDFEIILVLNGCNEPYYSKIKDYVNYKLRGYNVVLIQTDVGGVSNARNIALDCAKGEYITFIDDDDYVSDTYLQELFFAAAPDTISISNAVAFKDASNITPIKYQLSDIYRQFSTKSRICITSKVRKFFNGPCMKLIPLKYIRDRRFDVRFKNGEDSIFMFLISDEFNRIRFASQEAIYYRRYRDNSAVTQHRSVNNRLSNSLKVLNEYIKIYFSAPLKYNFIFFIQRVMVSFKNLWITIYSTYAKN